ncbi:MAG TPA: NAD(P)-dependent oxidoreductase [Anaerolineae bacterium]|nr:NAD(P)-dependent oxidoreductase [Anaerolineae bacterium]
MTKIAFLGLGIMGSGMARNLIQAGFEVTVWNRTVAKAQPLVEAGATLAETPAAAASGAEVILSIVGDDHSSREVWAGPQGILAGQLKPGALAIECTTISLEWVKTLHLLLTEAGLRFIDCPVTGGRGGAEDGTLTLLIGADEEVLIAAQPVLEAISERIIHFGPPGAGTAFKLLYNMLGAAILVGLGEAIALAEKANLRMDKVVEGLTSGFTASPGVKAFAQRMVDQDHDYVNFSAHWMHKDASYALKMAADLGQAMPMSAVAAQIYQLALSQGMGEKNLSVVVEALR